MLLNDDRISQMSNYWLSDDAFGLPTLVGRKTGYKGNLVKDESGRLGPNIYRLLVALKLGDNYG